MLCAEIAAAVVATQQQQQQQHPPQHEGVPDTPGKRASLNCVTRLRKVTDAGRADATTESFKIAIARFYFMEGVAVDRDGRTTIDPNAVMGDGDGEAMQGAILPFASHRGYGLSLLAQLIGSAFSVAGYPGGRKEDGAGTFVLAINPGIFAGTDEYMARSREFLESVKSAKPIEGQHVRLPGERGDERAAHAKATGFIEIDDGLWNALTEFIDG